MKPVNPLKKQINKQKFGRVLRSIGPKPFPVILHTAPFLEMKNAVHYKDIAFTTPDHFMYVRRHDFRNGSEEYFRINLKRMLRDVTDLPREKPKSLPRSRN